MAIFPTFLFRQYRPGKYLLQYSRTKKRLSTLWKKEVRKVKKFKFYQRFLEFFHFSHGFGPTMAIFPTFLNDKTPFWAIKTRSSKSRKIDIFPNGLTHGFGPKMAIFSTFFFRQYRPGKYLLRCSRTKKTSF